MNNKPKYTYHPRGRNWCVYKNTYTENGGSYGEHVSTHPDKEEARKEVYKLNGWNYKPLKN